MRNPRPLGLIMATALMASLAGCTQPTAAIGDPAVIGEGWSTTTTGSGSSGCEFGGESGALLPDPGCTPGAVTTELSPADTGAVCGHPNITRPNVPGSVRETALDSYGLAEETPTEYVLDYLIPQGLGGANDFANLWPIPADDATATAKEEVEDKVILAVCGGQVGLQAAQYALANDWTKALDTLQLAPK